MKVIVACLLFALVAVAVAVPLRKVDPLARVPRFDAEEHQLAPRDACSNSPCGSGETCCLMPDGSAGCCPFPNACCCPDKQSCCGEYKCECTGCPGPSCSCSSCGSDGQCINNEAFNF
ncbi:Keratin, ultra high-sulfur matrix protein [Balamuthia mandrillaris]